MSTPPRNKRKVFSDLFKILREHVSKSVDYPLHKSLYTNTSEVEDNLIENCGIIANHTGSNNRLDILIEFQDNFYYCFTGDSIDTDAINKDYFEPETELFVGLWTLIQSQFIRSCLSNASSIEIYNEVLSFDESSESPNVAKEVAFDDISRHFINLNIYKVIPDTPYDCKDLYQIKGYFNVAIGNNNLIFNDSIKSNFIALYESGLRSIPMDIVELAYMSSQYKQVFLELYRCIEQLYPVPTLQSLLQVDGISLTCPITTAEVLETQLNWRPNQSDAIDAVFKDLDEVVLNKFNSVKSDTEYSAMSSSAFVYRLRNANVHFRKKLGRGTLENDKWELLIDVMLEATLQLYGKYNSSINIE
ncbi:hypothetical protein FMH16_21280 [Vibrio vulnificus]|nr:hypothetical protein [Vibrio vulnificus]